MTSNKFHHLIPKMYKINNRILHEIQYPCIFKLAVTYGGHGSHICDNEYQLKCYETKNREYFVQELIYGPIEYAAHLFIVNSIIKFGVCYSISNKYKTYIQKGKMDKYKKINNFDFTPFEQIFKVLKYTGFACIDFKITNSGIKIFEINPRLGGTIVHDKEDFQNLIKFIGNQIY